MSREPILSAEDAATPSEVPRGKVLTQEEYNAALRPQRMEDMVGQRKVYERLMIAVEAAQIRQEPLGHILLDGPPGLGKTTFATCIPRALDVPLQIASGAALAAPKDLLPYLTQATSRLGAVHRRDSSTCPRRSKSSCIRRWRTFASTSRSARVLALAR